MRASALSKYIDKYIGPFILIFLSFFKKFLKKRDIPKKMQQIAILKENAIGDAVLVTALIRELQKNYPQAKVTLYLSESNAISSCFISPSVEVIILKLKKPLNAIQTVRQKKFDIFIDTGAWPRINALIAGLSRSSFVVGFKTLNQNRHYLFDSSVEHCSDLHELKNYYNLIDGILKKPASLEPQLNITAKLPNEFMDQKYVVIHPWAGGALGEFREWNAQSWQQIIDYLHSSNINVYLSGSPIEKVKNQQFKNSQNIAGVYDFKTLLAIIDGSLITLSVNTGIMHIAAALSCWCIGLSGPTNPNRWGAIGEKSINIYPQDKGCGFLNLGFEYEARRTDCMQLITADNVIQSIKDIIDTDHPNIT